MGRRLVGLVLILAGLPALFLAPLGWGAVRMSGLSLAWWYGGIIAPVLVVVLTFASLRVRRDSDRSR